MGQKEQFRRLALELESLKDRVRELLTDPHWLTDGEWKESVLRTILRRHLPKHLEPLRGFVTTGAESSSQIDVLIYDNRKPVLFRDNDLVFITPDAVAGIIEVKSAISSASAFAAALEPLAANIERVRSGRNTSAFAGLFAFDTELVGYSKLEELLKRLHEISAGKADRVINLVSLGSTVFVLHWEGPESDGDGKKRWYGYNLPQMAPGYFISNIIHATVPDSVDRNPGAWFPSEPPDTDRKPKQEHHRFGVAVFEDYKAGGR